MENAFDKHRKYESLIFSSKYLLLNDAMKHQSFLRGKFNYEKFNYEKL